MPQLLKEDGYALLREDEGALLLNFNTEYLSSAGTLNSSGLITKLISKKTGQGYISFSGALEIIHTIFRSLAGVLTPAGVLAKLTGKKIGEGYVYFAGVLTSICTAFVSAAGTLTSAGALVKIPTKMLSGVLSFSGAFRKFVMKMPSGVLASAGSLTKNISKILVGAMTLAGTLSPIKYILKSVGGVLSFTGECKAALIIILISCMGTLTMAGNLSKRTYLYLSGALTSTGIAVKEIFKLCAGSIWYLAGAVKKNTSKLPAGTIIPAGELTVIRFFWKLLEGAITPAGLLLKKTGKVLAGALSSAGILEKYTKLLPAGTLGLAGVLSRNISKIVAGIITSSGALSKAIFISVNLSGVLIFTGSVVRGIHKNFIGVLSPSGILTRNINKIISGILIPSGSVIKKTSKFIGGALTSIWGKLTSWLAGKPFSIELTFEDAMELELAFD